MLAASTLEPACREMVEPAKESGGAEESTMIGFGGKVPCWMATFANGSMCHAMDYDDFHEAAGTHPTAASLPAALAMSERTGALSGKGLIVAVCVGNDLASRLGLALTQTFAEDGWQRPCVFGVFGAATAAGKILELNKDQMVGALAIAFTQASGTMEAAYGSGTNIRAIRDAFIAKTGILSALMARRGITGFTSCFEGRAGLFPVYFRTNYRRERVLANLGESFEGVNVSFKP